MSEEIEEAIRDLIVVNGNSDRVAMNLIKRLQTGSPSRKERNSFVNFLINAGYFHEVLELFSTWFASKENFPIYGLAYLLRNSGFVPGKQFLKHIQSAIEDLNPNDRPLHLGFWEKHEPKFLESRKNTLDTLQENQKIKKAQDIAKLEFYKAHRMIEEENKFLDELLIRYPEEESLKKDKSDFKERWAKAIIARSAYKAPQIEEDLSDRELSIEEHRVAKPMIDRMKEIAPKKPYLAYDLAICLFYMELFEPAKEILKFSPSNQASDWFLVEILLKCRRYVECLDALLSLEKKYFDDPETTFAAVYYRALALRALGQTDKAVELMNSIVTIRPTYRSAHAFLLNWKSA